MNKLYKTNIKYFSRYFYNFYYKNTNYIFKYLIDKIDIKLFFNSYIILVSIIFKFCLYNILKLILSLLSKVYLDYIYHIYLIEIISIIYISINILKNFNI